ncbi:MAG: hypothetical protein KDK90_04615 [Leptospiraceae bacterium]|nr:hypothetical protein [Leptospiraceae bacterium]
MSNTKTTLGIILFTLFFFIGCPSDIFYNSVSSEEVDGEVVPPFLSLSLMGVSNFSDNKNFQADVNAYNKSDCPTKNTKTTIDMDDNGAGNVFSGSKNLPIPAKNEILELKGTTPSQDSYDFYLITSDTPVTIKLEADGNSICSLLETFISQSDNSTSEPVGTSYKFDKFTDRTIYFYKYEYIYLRCSSTSPAVSYKLDVVLDETNQLKGPDWIFTFTQMAWIGVSNSVSTNSKYYPNSIDKCRKKFQMLLLLAYSINYNEYVRASACKFQGNYIPSYSFLGFRCSLQKTPLSPF